ncbi:hypothetical protein RHGRI_011627 [Rhododendron griersonianum]|uniref:Ribosomal protein S10 n=1 Tax=Rhododendron griersonianum TaxID=479676 RepID=A0AAV6KNG7_9ERIC|nr:hypothetical protein RHGRI_011627 [Rhododendron griersonianum]
MSSLRISNCLNNYATFPIGSTYMNLYKLPESTMELVSPMGGEGGAGKNQSPRVLAKSISCRQVYLRSYSTFGRKELVPEQNDKCFHRVGEISAVSGGRRRRRRRRRTKLVAGGKRRWRCVMVVRRVKEFSCTVLRAFLHKLLSCAVSVDVVDYKAK